MMSGDVPASFQLLPNVLSQVKDGKMRPISVMSRTRSNALPNVSTMVEQGVSGMESAAWFGLLLPRGTPRPIKGHLNKEVVKVLDDPAMQNLLIEICADPISSTQEEFKELVTKETTKWRELIKAMNIKPASAAPHVQTSAAGGPSRQLV